MHALAIQCRHLVFDRLPSVPVRSQPMSKKESGKQGQLLHYILCSLKVFSYYILYSVMEHVMLIVMEQFRLRRKVTNWAWNFTSVSVHKLDAQPIFVCKNVHLKSNWKWNRNSVRTHFRWPSRQLMECSPLPFDFARSVGLFQVRNKSGRNTFHRIDTYTQYRWIIRKNFLISLFSLFLHLYSSSRKAACIHPKHVVYTKYNVRINLYVDY
jgi:hypothetical protein